MKALKILFSRFSILFLATLAQVVALAVVLGFYAQYFVWLEAVSLLFSLIVILHTVNRDTPAEFKLPWIMLLTVSPILGVLLYACLANPKLRKRQSRALAELERRRAEYLALPSDQGERLGKVLGEHAGVEHYLNKTAYSHGTLGNSVSYYGEGDAFFDALCRELERAKDFILLEYFSIEKGALWDRIHAILLKKHREGVEVRILYDDLGTLGKLSAGYAKHLSAEGLTCRRFNRLYPILSGIFNYRDHRKIAVIDGRVGFTGGLNVGDEYAGITHPFGKWKDAGVCIKGPSVGNLTLLFLQLWETAGAHGEADYSRYFPPIAPTTEEGGYCHAFGCGPRPFYREGIAENTLLNLIGGAKRSICITTPYLIVGHSLLTALKNAAGRGVDVRIITPHVPDKRTVFQLTRASYRPLLAAGVRIYEYTPGFIHAKQVLVDGTIALVGSINLDHRSLSHHFECAALLCHSPALGEVAADFAEVLAVSTEVDAASFHMGALGRLTASLLSILSPLF